jgi:oxaloacetate decarboxylase beta subunit
MSVGKKGWMIAACLAGAAGMAFGADTDMLSFSSSLRSIMESTGIAKFFGGVGWQNFLMVCVGLTMLYLGVAKDMEPLLMVPMGFGAILANTPGSGLLDAPHGFLKLVFDVGIYTEVLPILIFMGIGAMCDFAPLIANPRMALLGAAAQLGVFGTLIGVVLANDVFGLGFDIKQACAVAIIGAADGPTSIYMSGKYAPDLMGSIAVAAYSYMAMVPLIQPPVMRLLTTKKERLIRMPVNREVSQKEKMFFPLIVLALCVLLLPPALPLMGSFCFGNFIRECGATERLSKALQNEIANIATILLGLGVGTQMVAEKFLAPVTLAILGLGLLAFVVGTAGGVIFAKIMNWLSPHNPVNPLIGSAGVSAFPMAARVSHRLGQEADPTNFLIFQAMGANVAGQVGSVAAAGVILALLG